MYTSACNNVFVNDPSCPVLCEQAMLLDYACDRLVALRRTTSYTQVLLARSLVMKALSLLAIRFVVPS